MPNDLHFWESAEAVQRFAGFEPDDRLIELLAGWQQTGARRALDLGCAGGRNSESLVRAGFETWALDLSVAMSRATRERLHSMRVPRSARGVVVRGRFDRLPFVDECFDVVVAVGIYILADSDAEFRAGLTETYRVLRPGGCTFVTQWSSQTLPADAQHVAGQRYVYASQPGETRCRLNKDELVAETDRVGLVLDGDVSERHSERDGEKRVALIGVFRKPL